MPDTTLLLTLRDICTLCDLTWWAAYRLARHGVWKGRLVLVGCRRTWVFERVHVLKWLKQNARSAKIGRPNQHHDAGQGRRRASA